MPLNCYSHHHCCHLFAQRSSRPGDVTWFLRSLRSLRVESGWRIRKQLLSRRHSQSCLGEPEALQPAAPPEEEQAQHVEDFLAQELEEADVQSLAQRSQRSHYDDPLVEAAFDHNQRAQREIVESVSTLLSQQPAMSAELLMLRQEDIQKFSVTMTQAPAGFRRRYDTGADFSWALAGFNFVVGSFYRGGIRTHESQSEICACASSQIFASKAL